MDYLTFANKEQMPILGLGTWKAAPGEVGAAVKEAIRLGYRHIDCAAIYGNEAEIGVALQELLAGGEVSRDQLWITSKLWNNAHGRTQVVEALKNTLADLQLDYLDLYLIHWPIAFCPGVTFPSKPEEYLTIHQAPLTETWAGMEDCVERQLARHIGVSNFSIDHLEDICQAARKKPEVNQVELHPYLQQPELLEYCRKKYIYLTAYSPLGSVDRPTAMKRPDEPGLLDHATVMAIADRHGCTPAQVLIRFAIERGVAVIPKSTNPQRLAENLAATDLVLPANDMAALRELESGFRYIDGSFFTSAGSPYTLKWLWGDA